MKNAESIRKRLNEVKNMKSYTEALTALADIQYDIGMDACHEREELRLDVEKLRAVIMGNGDPEHSMMNRLTNVEKSVNESGSDLSDIRDAILGKIDGRKGLLDRMESAEKVNASMIKLMWLVVGVVVTEIVALILGLL